MPQLLFDTSDFKPSRIDNVYLAVRPSPIGRAEIHRFALEQNDKLRLFGNLVASDSLHASLINLGARFGVPPRLVPDADVGCSSVAAMMKPFKMMFDGMMSYGGAEGNWPLVLCGGDNAELRELHRRLLLEPALVPYIKSKAFNPHISFLYASQQLKIQRAEMCVGVEEIVLVRSTTDRSGTRHVDLRS